MEQKEKDALKLKLLRLANSLFDETFKKCNEDITELNNTKYVVDGILLSIKCIDED